MATREITVRYEEKVGLPNYSNSTYGLTEIITLSDEDDADTVRADATALLSHMVRSEIDRILEANGRPAKYEHGPRYKVLKTYPKTDYVMGKGLVTEDFIPILLILPDVEDLPKLEGVIGWTNANGEVVRWVTYRHACEIAAQAELDGWATLDCSNLDMSKLQPFLKQPKPEPEDVERQAWESHREDEITADEDDYEDEDDEVDDESDVITI